MRGCATNVALLAAAVAALLPLGSARADVLFSTTSDFTGWSANTASNTATPSPLFDYDGATVNGAGNNPGNSGSTLGAGQSSAGGSLQTTWSPDVGSFGVLAFAPGEAFNPAFMTAVDPGSSAAYQPPSYTAGSTVAYSGVIQMVYSIPGNVAGGANGYYELGLDLSYPADGYYQTFFPDAGNTNALATGSVTPLGTINGQNLVLATIPYTITAGAGNLTGFGFGIAYNSNYAPVDPIYIDSITTGIAATPEPASLGCLGTAMSLLMLRRRRHA